MHPRQLPLDSAIGEVWLAALADAGIKPQGALLYTFPRERSEVEKFGAVHWLRGRLITAEGSDIAARLPEINHEECIDAARVGLWTSRPIEACAALLRHELEHVRQYALHPGLDGLHELAEDVVRRAPESGRIYNEISTELEANRAGAAFVRARFGDGIVDAILVAGSEDGAALRYPSAPSSRDDLPERMIRFLVAHSALCEQYARSGGGVNDPVATFRRFMNRAYDGAGDRWEAWL